MLRRLYDWVMSLAKGRYASYALGIISFVESSFFPIPPDVMLIPMVIADRRAWIRLALICTITSVLGALLGYAIGALLFDPIAKPLLEFYGYYDKFEEFRHAFNQWGLLIIFVFGLTPFPYKVITITSGVIGLGLPVFIISSIIARGLRFFIVAGLLYLFGEPIRTFIEKRLGLMFLLFCVLLIGGFIAVKFLI